MAKGSYIYYYVFLTREKNVKWNYRCLGLRGHGNGTGFLVFHAFVTISKSKLLGEDWMTHLPTLRNQIQNKTSECESSDFHSMVLIC